MRTGGVGDRSPGAWSQSGAGFERATAGPGEGKSISDFGSRDGGGLDRAASDGPISTDGEWMFGVIDEDLFAAGENREPTDGAAATRLVINEAEWVNAGLRNNQTEDGIGMFALTFI